MHGPGDAVSIRTRLDDGLEIDGEFIITFFDKERSLLYTCGHCFPTNAELLKDGQLLCTSGYMETDRDDGIEVAIVRLWNSFAFSDYIKGHGRLMIDPQRATPSCSILYLFHRGNRTEGRLWGLVRSARVVYKGVSYSVEHMPRVNEPCLAIVGQAPCDDHELCLLTRHGFSGSPWCARRGEHFELVGAHVAKVVLRAPDGRRFQASLAVPVDRMRSQASKCLATSGSDPL